MGVIVLSALLGACGDSREHVYGQTPNGPLHLSLFVPALTAPPRALIVLFHGGGWWTGSPEQFSWFAQRLSEEGYLVALPEYRTHGKHGTGIPDAADDALVAMRWLDANRQKFNASGAPLILGGGSAGGHLALAAASALHSPPDALWLLNPVLDLHSASTGSGFSSGELKLIRGLSDEQRNALSFMQSGNLAETLTQTPSLLVFGEQDPLWGEYKEWLTLMASKTEKLRLILVGDATHGFFNSTDQRGAVLEEALRFFGETVGGGR